MLNDLAHISSGRIAPIPHVLVKAVRDDQDQKDYLQVAGLAVTHENFLVRGEWPGANGWERTTGDVATPADLPRFHDVVRAMAAK